MTDTIRYGLKTMSLECEECGTELGYIVFRRWIDYDYALCNLCMEKKLIEGLHLVEKREEFEKGKAELCPLLIACKHYEKSCTLEKSEKCKHRFAGGL